MKREESIDYNVKAVWHAISRMYNQYGAPFDISASTGFVLLNIDRKEGTPATKIAPLLGLETRSLTRLLKALEAKGFIERKPDPDDKRSVRICLTELGKEKKAISKKLVKAFNNKVIDKISPSKYDIFLEVMQEINNVLEENEFVNDIKI